jgi:hypothetical protein
VALLGCQEAEPSKPSALSASENTAQTSSESQPKTAPIVGGAKPEEPPQTSPDSAKSALPHPLEQKNIPIASRKSQLGDVSDAVAKTMPHPRDLLANKSRGSLPFLMKECGYRFSYPSGGDLERFMKAAIEPAQTGALEGRFKIATTVHRVPTSDQAKNKADAFRTQGQFGNNGKSNAAEMEDRIDSDDIAIQMALPFRLYKADSIDSERTKGVKGVSSVAVDRADTSDIWFLTRDDSLAKCSPREAQLVLARNGTLYFGESRNSRLIFRGFDSNPHEQKLRNVPYNNFDPIQHTNQTVICEIEVERLTYGQALAWQDSWGYYRREAMLSEEGDSDYILHWNFTGVLSGMTPDYFRPTKSTGPLVVSAKLLTATLRTREGEVIASYREE